jgi:hypothetical protein
MAEVAEVDDVQPLGPEVEDRHLVLRPPLGGLEGAHRFEPDPPDDPAPFGELQAPDHLERRDDLPEVAVIAVVLVADGHDVRRLVDRRVTPESGDRNGSRMTRRPAASIRKAACPYQMIRIGASGRGFSGDDVDRGQRVEGRDQTGDRSNRHATPASY